MTEIILSCCDFCNPECNEHPLDGRGVAVASEEESISVFGWVRTPNGIKCQKCQEDEEVENGKEKMPCLQESYARQRENSR